MTFEEAEAIFDRYIDSNEVYVAVVRILPEDIDPVVNDDNGWDVEFTIR